MVGEAVLVGRLTLASVRMPAVQVVGNAYGDRERFYSIDGPSEREDLATVTRGEVDEMGTS